MSNACKCKKSKHPMALTITCIIISLYIVGINACQSILPVDETSSETKVEFLSFETTSPDAAPQERQPEPPATNNPPVWESDTAFDIQIAEGTHKLFPLPAATDPNHDKLTYTIKGVPPFGEFLKDTHKLQLAPPFVGEKTTEYTITIEASDGKTSISKSIKVTVNPVSWTKLWEGGPLDRPEFRQKPAMFYDTANKRPILFGGAISGKQEFTDVWAFQGDKWIEVKAKGDIPTMGTLPVMIHADGESYALLLQAFNLQVSLALPTSYKLDLSQQPPLWTKVNNTNAPNLLGSCAAYDKKRKRFLVYAGINLQTGQNETDLYSVTVDGNTAKWSKVPAKAAPVGRVSPACTIDTTNDQFVFFGGNTATGNVITTPAETWVLSLSETNPSWNRLSGPQPQGRRNGLAFYDSKGHRIFLWSGRPKEPNALKEAWFLDLNVSPPVWNQIKATGLPPGERSSASGIYDPTNNRILVGFGNSSLAIYQDIWAFPLD